MRINMSNLILFFVTVSSPVASQIRWKIASRRFLRFIHVRDSLAKHANLWFIGWMLYLLATAFLVYLLINYDFSATYTIFVGSYIVLSLIIDLVFFKENTDTLYKTVGGTLILCAITFILRC